MKTFCYTSFLKLFVTTLQKNVFTERNVFRTLSNIQDEDFCENIYHELSSQKVFGWDRSKIVFWQGSDTLKIAVLKKFTKITNGLVNEPYISEIVDLKPQFKKGAPIQLFPWKFCEFFQISFSLAHLWTTPSEGFFSVI